MFVFIDVSPAGEWGRGDKGGKWDGWKRRYSHVGPEAAALVESASENWGKKCEGTLNLIQWTIEVWIKHAHNEVMWQH